MASPRPPHGIFESAGSNTLALTQGLLIAALVIVILIALTLAVWGWHSRRKARPKILRNPWDELKSEIEAHRNAAPREHMEKLGHALRKGLEMRTTKGFTAWTSAEVLAKLKDDEAFSSDFQSQCAQFLRTLDLVLYANEPWSESDRLHWTGQISAWLESLQYGRPL